MGLRLFPQPTCDYITPFLPIDGSVYRCLDEHGSTLEVSLRDGRVLMSNEGTQRTPNRDRVLEWAEHFSRADFGEFVASTHVVPTFSRTPVEALVRVVMRQIVTRLQARRTIDRFIREQGTFGEGVYGFPDETRIRAMQMHDFTQLGLGFRSARLVEAVSMCPSHRSMPSNSLPGIGPWSRAVLECDLRRDYRHYPMWDKSGEVAGRLLRISMEDFRTKDPELAADLYIYALAWADARE